MMKLAIDGMGGDHAPQAVVEGVKLALEAYSDIEIQLYGDQAQLEALIEPHERLKIIQTTEIIEGEDEPVRAIRRKKDASMVRAVRAVKEGEADAVLSAGNTGALLAAGLLIIGRIKGIDRPGLMPLIPTFNPDHPQVILMDSGANADSKPENLHQFGVLANFYAKYVLNIQQPRIGLLNNGTEAGKGSQLAKTAYELLNAEENIHFIGNVEPTDILTGKADILITDGYTGNIALKTLEGTVKEVMKLLKNIIYHTSPTAKLGGLLLSKQLKHAMSQLSASNAGAAVLLGILHPLLKAHGSSDGPTMFAAIRQARTVVESQAINKAVDYFARIK